MKFARIVTVQGAQVTRGSARKDSENTQRQISGRAPQLSPRSQ